MNSESVEVAVAILHSSGRFLLQLRDNIPGIRYPGCWAFFGGHLEPGETPEAAMQRELIEEIGYSPPELVKFRCYAEFNLIRHVFQAPLGVELHQLVLKEGWDMDWWTPAQIRSGSRYSEKAAQIRPLGRPHHQILLDFLDFLEQGA